MTARRG